MITVFGSINLDLIFRTEALPNPGQTVLAASMRTEPGGKGANQAAAAARDGAHVAMVGAVGRDAMAETALAGVRAAGADLSASPYVGPRLAAPVFAPTRKAATRSSLPSAPISWPRTYRWKTRCSPPATRS